MVNKISWVSLARRIAQWIRSAPIVWVGLLVAVEIILARRQLGAPTGFDESYFVWEGWAVNHRLVPYRDFIEFKPPVVFWMNGLALRLFGVSGFGFRWLFILSLVVATVLLFAVLCRRGGDRALAFLAAAGVAYATMAPHLHDSSLDDSETIGMLFFLYGTTALLWNGARRDITVVLGGALLSLAALSKEPYAVPVLATWATLGFLAREERGLPWRRYATLTLFGVAAVVVPVLLYLVASRALPFYLRDVRLYFSYAKQIGCEHPHSLRELAQQAWPLLAEKVLIPEMFASAVPLLVAFAVLPGTGLAVRVGLALAVLGGFYAVTVGGCYFPHYYTMGLTGLFLWIALGTLALSRWLAEGPFELRRWVRWALLAGAVVHMGPTVALAARTSYPIPHGGTLGVSPSVIAFVKKSTSPRDTIFSDGSPALYVLTDRRPAIREVCLLDEFIPVGPGHTDEERLAPLRAELLARPPKVVYFGPEFAGRKQRTRNALWIPFLRDQHYQKISDELYVHP
jgi:hypothetical protein